MPILEKVGSGSIDPEDFNALIDALAGAPNTARVQLSAAEFAALGTTPKVVVPGQAGKMIVGLPSQIVFEITTAWSGGTRIGLWSGTSMWCDANAAMTLTGTFCAYITANASVGIAAAADKGQPLVVKFNSAPTGSITAAGAILYCNYAVL